MKGLPKMKKNGNPLVYVLSVVFIAFLVAMAAGLGGDIYKAKVQPGVTSSLGDADIEAQAVAITEAEAKSCDGIASVGFLYNDQDAYSLATDPATNLTIYSPIVKSMADDASSVTLPIKRTYTGLAANTLGSIEGDYFAKEVEIETVCGDIEFQPKLSQAGAPTLTITNDNGVTLNANASDEAMDADSTYTATLTVKAPSNKVSSEYGAYVVFEYDATYVQSVDSSDLVKDNTGVYLAHTGNLDQFQVMRYDGVLADGDKDEISFDVSTTSSTPGADAANVKVHWLPINKDLNADTLDLITGIYDEDNNAIYPTSQTALYYTS